MAKNLLIVESPAKAKTIEKFLGSDFKVLSSVGHIRDLEKGELGVDIANGFKPKYIISPEKTRVVRELKEAVKGVEDVWLATDEDREGEAISWHLAQVLNLDVRKTKRIVFHEITKPAIQKAVQNPRLIDLNLVDAQQARRILDRLVGFELSGVLWKKVKGKLSAGRVQSVTVKLVVEREREIQHFSATPFFKIAALYNVQNAQGKTVTLKAEAPQRFDQEQEAKNFLQKCIPANYKIEAIEPKLLKRKPTAPFTTSSLQQEASRKLGYSVDRTMKTAQRLYEAGHITYMRTDSTNLSEDAVASIAAEIRTSYGDNYVHTRQYKTNKAGAQEAHEAIRPTYAHNRIVSQDPKDRDQQRLYELIWKRTIACQMADAEIEKTTVKIGISTIADTKLQAEGEVIKFDGFLKVYLEGNDNEDEDEAKGMLPPLKIGQMLDLEEMTATQRFTRPPARYTEASLVKQLEELGIGRPSTYAPTISKIMEEERGYVKKETRDGVERLFEIFTLKQGKITQRQGKEMTGAMKNQLIPADMGMIVVDFLGEHFEDVMNYNFTADVEKQFDGIADGKQKWTQMLENFYPPFHALVEETIAGAGRASGERILGKDPETGRTVLVRLSKFGPVVQIGQPDELAKDEKPRYANLKPEQSMETVGLDDVLGLFGLPKTLGRFQEEEIIVSAGRFGPYIKYKEMFVSLAKGEDPFEVTLSRAVDLIQEKLKADAPITHYEGKPVTKGIGRFGPFIKWNDMFINIPVRYKIDSLTLEQAIEIIVAKLDKEANRYIQQWESENLAIENGRWGPFIRHGKDNYKLVAQGKKLSNEEATTISLADVKAIVEEQNPDAFKVKAKSKKAVVKKK